MQTLGRESEKQRALQYLRSPAQAAEVNEIIDLVHDYLDGIGGIDQLTAALRRALVDGHSGVWQQVGYWLLKLACHDPRFGELWRELSKHPRARVRFRVAAFVEELPLKLQGEIRERLISDRSAKVREKANERELIRLYNLGM